MFTEGGPLYEEQKWKREYEKGKYVVIVIVYSGRVIVVPYDEHGPRYDEAVELTAGQTFCSEDTYGIKDEAKEHGVKYRTTIDAIEGDFVVYPCDDTGPRYDMKIDIKEGQILFFDKYK